MILADANHGSGIRPATLGPGDRLRAARTELGLSVEDISDKMHLTSGIVEAIEANEFCEITAPIFVKGYLRAYARIVNLNEEEIIQLYLKYYSNEDPPVSAISGVVPQISSNDALIKWITCLVIIVLIALLAAWWWNNSNKVPDVVSLDAQESSLVDSIGETQSSDVVVAEPEASPAEANGIVDEAEPALVEQTSTVENVIKVETEETVIINETNFNQANTQTATGSDRLQILVHADTWADIKDGGGRQIVYDLLRADQEFNFIGEAPFDVFFGNGYGVEVKLNGEVIDISGRIREDNTARLRAGS